VEHFTPVINLPQAAILGVSALVDVPVPCEGDVVFIPMLPLSLTADHRIVDGAVAAAFIDQLKREIENPAGLVL
jgi:pyruvate dehydrogenase E2 component (dihydrolipoamide acetyltransferase)